MILIFLFNLIFSKINAINEVALYEVIELKNYYISELNKSIFSLTSSTNGNIILQILDKEIDTCYVCLNQKDVETLENCKKFNSLRKDKDNNLGSFSNNKIFFVFINLGKIILFNDNQSYSIDVNNQNIKCFNYYTKYNNLKFNLFFKNEPNIIINIQYASNLQIPGTIRLYSQNSTNIFYANDKFINHLELLESKHKYFLDFSPPASDNINSILCLSFRKYDELITIPLIHPKIFEFYMYGQNSSNINGISYLKNFQFTFRNNPYRNCSLFYYKINKDFDKEQKYECNLKKIDNKTYNINLEFEQDAYATLKLFNSHKKTNMYYSRSLLSNKNNNETEDYEEILSYLNKINNTLKGYFPLCFSIFLLIYFLVIFKKKIKDS